MSKPEGNSTDEVHRVLLVEDQPTVAEWVRQSLMAPDIALFACSDARAAVQAAHAVAPTVILQDLVMPQMSGFDLLGRYKAAPSIASIPVIVLSSIVDVDEKARAFELGAADYMVKLPHPTELNARVRAHSRAFRSRTEREELTTHLHQSMQRLSESNAQLVKFAREDGLTGLANRRALDEALDKEWRRAQRERTPLSFALIDLDFFKLYNDHYGHVRGDECLRTIARMVSGRARRPGDLAARYGGEELGLLLPCTPAAGAYSAAEDVRRSIAELCLPHEARTDGFGFVSASFGVATLVPTLQETARAVVETADAALYEAKRRGRNQVVHASLSE